jgi:hypothetical protein
MYRYFLLQEAFSSIIHATDTGYEDVGSYNTVMTDKKKR